MENNLLKYLLYIHLQYNSEVLHQMHKHLLILPAKLPCLIYLIALADKLHFFQHKLYRTFLGRQGLEDAAQPREHGQSAVLQFLDLQLFQVTRFGQAQRVESTTRGDVTRDESVVKRVGRQARSVRFRGANQDGFDDQNVPEGRVARAFRRQRGDGARELVRDGGAVIRGAQGTGGEPRDTGAVLGGPGASDAQLGPSAVDDFTLGVLFVAKRDDRGFAPTRVGTEFRVDVSLDNLGDGLGLFFLFI